MNKCRMVTARLTKELTRLMVVCWSGPVVAEVTDVIELAPTVARDILAPASYIQVAPSAVACAGARDHHAIRTVGFNLI
jgi:hypothetical protein